MAIEIVAEISGNHAGEKVNAMMLVEAAKQAGANCVKLQLFDPEKLAKRRANNAAVLRAAHGRDLLDLYRETVTPREWFPSLFRLCEEIGLDCYSSVFDPDDVEFLEELGADRYKIASFEINDHELIEAVSATALPIVMSAPRDLSMDDINSALALARSNLSPVTLLHATRYDTSALERFDLERLQKLNAAFGSVANIGISLHNEDLKMLTGIVATTRISMVEAHIMLPDVKTPDADFSLTPRMFKRMVSHVRSAAAD